jgi:hypothetical protein
MNYAVNFWVETHPACANMARSTRGNQLYPFPAFCAFGTLCSESRSLRGAFWSQYLVHSSKTPVSSAIHAGEANEVEQYSTDGLGSRRSNFATSSAAFAF